MQIIKLSTLTIIGALSFGAHAELKCFYDPSGAIYTSIKEGNTTYYNYRDRVRWHEVTTGNETIVYFPWGETGEITRQENQLIAHFPLRTVYEFEQDGITWGYDTNGDIWKETITGHRMRAITTAGMGYYGWDIMAGIDYDRHTDGNICQDIYTPENVGQ